MHQPFERDPKARLDPAGVALLAVGLVALLLALDFAADGDLLRPISLGLLAVSVVAMLAFVAVERRSGERALVPRDVMANRQFRRHVRGRDLHVDPAVLGDAVPSAVLLQGAGLQRVRGGPRPTTAVGVVRPRLVRRCGQGRAVDIWLLASIGAACQFVGIFVLSFLDVDDDFFDSLGGMVVLGVGIGLFNSAATTSAVTSLDHSRASLGGAVLYMFQVAGGAVGLALTTAVFALVSHQSVNSDVERLGGSPTQQELRDLQGVLAGTDSAQEVQLELPGRRRHRDRCGERRLRGGAAVGVPAGRAARAGRSCRDGDDGRRTPSGGPPRRFRVRRLVRDTVGGATRGLTRACGSCHRIATPPGHCGGAEVVSLSGRADVAVPRVGRVDRQRKRR